MRRGTPAGKGTLPVPAAVWGAFGAAAASPVREEYRRPIRTVGPDAFPVAVSALPRKS